jgi:hypothetical protein
MLDRLESFVIGHSSLVVKNTREVFRIGYCRMKIGDWETGELGEWRVGISD